jgi:ABC-type sugar transport system substrate-binding protein
MKKRFLWLIVLVVLLFSMISVVALFAEKEEKLTVGLVQIGLTHPFHIAEAKGANEAAKRLDINVKIVSGEGNLNKQIEVFENLVQQKVDSIVVNTIDGKAFGPAFEKAKAAGIPILTLHTVVPGAVAMLGFDEIKTGSEVGAFTVELLEQKYGQPKGEVAILQGMLGQDANTFRTKGFTDVMDKYPGIKVVAMTPTDWDPKKGVEVTENYLVAYPKLDIIYGLSDGMTVPAANTVKNAGKLGPIRLVSVDGGDYALEAVKNGDLECTYLLGDVFVGYQYIKYGHMVAKGEKVPERILVKGAIVTKDNVDAAIKLKKEMKDNISNFPFDKTLPEIIDMYK